MVKIVHMALINGNVKDVENLGQHLKKVVEDTKGEYEFLVTNDRVQVRDPRDLLEEYKSLIMSFEEVVGKYTEKEKEAEKNEKSKN